MYITDTFDLNHMKEAAKLLEGHHDFRTFMSKHLSSDDKITRRIVDYIRISETNKSGYSSYSWPSNILNNSDEYLFIDVYMKSKSFLYKQVSEL
ncbi:hypothetical protein NQ314_002839 [Rhamnusium bicolor]|uniref:Pseudouridine synthase I TruA alpha/beta domain-containing protein n=1 Tax=Rhamnusium bicolor TaxID=1586634 RepID=A0AAV8ZRC5_9CUCU|nr:hypothetical protein NQ314_002839 [Rhamnusium bicolor]